MVIFERRTFQADALSRLPVALEGLRALRVAVARVALLPGVAPVVLLALVALPPPEAVLARALPVVQVARLRRRAHRVAVARLAALAGGDLPVVFLAPEIDTLSQPSQAIPSLLLGFALRAAGLHLSYLLSAIVPDDVGQALAFSGEAVAGKVLLGERQFFVVDEGGRVSAEHVTLALLAHVLNGVAEKARLAELAVVALGVEEALEADTRVRVAVASVLEVPVVGAVAAVATAAGDLGVAIEVVGAHVTAGAC